MFQNGGWPELAYREIDEEQQKTGQRNMEALARLLEMTTDEWVELYGVWAGDYAKAPAAREERSLPELLDAQFCFKERCLYRIRVCAL